MTAASQADHRVHFYEDDERLSAAVTGFVGEGLPAGELIIVIATRARGDAFRRRLAELGFDVPGACASGQLVFADADETLARVMRGRDPDRELFEAEVGRLIPAAGDGPRRRAYGEMVDILWQQGEHEAALKLDELWSDFQGRRSFTLLCAYPTARRDEIDRGLRASVRELRAREEALRRSEAEIRAITDALPVLVAHIDRDHRYRFVSAAFERWFGRPTYDAIGRRVDEVVGADAYRLIGPYLDRALAGEAVTWQAEVPYQGAGTRWVEAAYTPQRAADGQVTGCVALVLDITERKQLAAHADQLYRFAGAVVAAERVEDVYEAALDSIGAGLGARRAAILAFDGDGVMRFRAARGLSEAYRRAVEGHSPWARDVVAPRPVLVADVEADPDLAPLLPVLRQEGIHALAFFPLVSRGRLLGKFVVYHEHPHRMTTADLELAAAIANHLASVMARFRAIAELEETIRYNELFAGVLAHDLRNPLGAMMTAAQIVMMRQDGDGADSLKPLARIVSSGQRMTRMIDQLLDFTRARVGGGIVVRPRPANLADLCGQVIAELELAYPEWRIERGVLGDTDGSWDPDRLLQIVSNLVANAGQHGAPEAGILVLVDGRTPESVSVRIYNKGAIPPALMPTLFDPFRGTRHRGGQSRGLGLGLYIVKELVRAHGGTVDVTSSESAGTTFTIVLPRQAPPSIDARLDL